MMVNKLDRPNTTPIVRDIWGRPLFEGRHLS